MTGLEILLYIYLAGAVGTSATAGYMCHEAHGINTQGCIAISVVAGVAWPAVVYEVMK